MNAPQPIPDDTPSSPSQPSGPTALAQDRLAWAVGALICAVLMASGAPGPTWLDSGELIAAARELGGIHPPGHPAWLSLSAWVEWLPLGPQAARLAWMSALFAGLSGVFTVRIGRRLLGAFGETTAGSVWAAAGGLMLLASASLWLVGNRVEVYTLALFTNLWALDAGLRAGDAAAGTGRTLLPRAGAIALAEMSVAICLGLLNHHYIALLGSLAALIAAFPAVSSLFGPNRKLLGGLLGVSLWLGLGYVALVWRAGADIEMRWGDPGTLSGLWDTVTAAHFQKSVTQADVSLTDNALVLFGAIAHGMGLWLAAFGALGLALGWLRRDRAWLAVVVAFAAGLATKAPMQIDTHNPDDHGYVLMAVAALALGAPLFGSVLFGPRGLLAGLPQDRKARLGLFVLPWIAALLVLNTVRLWGVEETNPMNARASDVVDSHLREEVAPGALYLSDYYALAFNEQAWRIAEGRRPDMAVAHISFRTGDTDGGRAWQRWFARRRPEYALLAKGAGHLGRTPVGNILPLREQHDVYVEIDKDKRFPPTVLEFRGLVQRVLPDAEAGLDYDLGYLQQRRKDIWTDLYARLERAGPMDPQTRRVLAWQHALQAGHALRRGWRAIAADELVRGQKLAPRDRLLARLQYRLDALNAAWKRGDSVTWRRIWQGYARMDFEELTADVRDPPVTTR